MARYFLDLVSVCLHGSFNDIRLKLGNYLACILAFFGYFADRCKLRRMPFVVGLASLSASTGLFALARSLPLLIIARALQGLSAAAVWIVGLSIIADNVPTERVGEAMSYTTVALAWGSLLGPAVGGVMYEKVGFYGAFIVPMCLLVVDIAMRFAMIERKSKSKVQYALSG